MLKYQQEFLSQVELDIQYLIELHWSEIALNQDNIKLNPDWSEYHSLEEHGKLKIFTARDNDRLVGYFVVIVGNNIHTKTTCLQLMILSICTRITVRVLLALG